MKTLIHAALFAVSLAGGALLAQQPAPPSPQPRQPAPPDTGPGDRFARRIPPIGFPMATFSPTALLERRQTLGLTPEQVTRLSTLENDLRAARDKSEADAKPHRDELDKLWQQGAPDVAQIRTHAQAMMQAEQAARLAALTATAQAKAVLTAEQRGRVQGWADARRNQGGGRMFRRPGDPRGRGPDDSPGPRMRRPAGFGFQRGAGQL